MQAELLVIPFIGLKLAGQTSIAVGAPTASEKKVTFGGSGTILTSLATSAPALIVTVIVTGIGQIALVSSLVLVYLDRRMRTEGLDLELRERSSAELVALDFDAYAIGGLSVGEHREPMFEATSAAAAPRTGLSSSGLEPIPPPRTTSSGSRMAQTVAMAEPRRAAT